jgi:uncharacterized protein (DUF427 family)
MSDSEPRHYAVIDQYNRKLTLKYKGQILAESTNALILKEVAKTVYNPSFYFPKEDVKMELELEADRNSHCPIKGDATYWNLKDNPTDNYFAWSYDHPNTRSNKIKEMIAFNPEYITIMSEPIG